MTGPVTTLDPPVATRLGEIAATIPSVFDVAIMIVGIGTVLLFLGDAVLVGSDDWIVRFTALLLPIIITAYIQSIRRIIAWREFLDRHGLSDVRWFFA